jgi:cytochrome P450
MTTTSERSPARPRAVPGPRGNAMLGMLLDVWRDRLGLMTGVTEKYGDAVRFTMGPKSLYFFNHPEHAKHVLADNHANYHKGIGLIHAKRVLGDGLLTSEGDLWRRQRRTIQPTFQRERLARFAGTVAGEADALVRRWRGRAGGAPVDVVEEMTHVALGVMGKTLLDTDLGAYESVGHAFDVVQDQAMFEMQTLGMVPHRAPLPRHFRFRKARRELDRVVSELVDTRQREGYEGRDDMLSRLLLAYRDESDEQVRRQRLSDELITILLAGHETTAATLSWTWYRVSQNPEIGQRMHAEAVEVLGDRLPRYEDLHELRYITMVLQEAMRLYPPVWILPRRAVGPDEIGGYPVPAGADVMICPYTLHRHPEFWDDPDRFDPDRFDTERAAARHRYAYIPFGGGPRFCVGSNLGMMEAVFVAAMVAREFQLDLASGRQVVGEPMLSLRVKDGLPMTIRAAR